MNPLELVTQQQQQENRALKTFLVRSLLLSLVAHGAVLSLGIGHPWDAPGEPAAEELEVLVTDLSPEPPPIAPADPQPEVQTATPPAIAPPPSPGSSPTPAKSEPAARDPQVQPRDSAIAPNPAGGPGNSPGSPSEAGVGAIARPGANGSGFGRAMQSPGWPVGGLGTGQSEPVSAPTALRTAPPAAVPLQPICLSCPKPKYQGTEASPRVDLRIRADGTVEVRLRQSSGSPELDRQTLETMRQWRFDPQTVPAEGVRKRVRVTYEEEGSTFQRQNAERRQAEAERSRPAQPPEQRPPIAKEPISPPVPSPPPAPAGVTDPVLEPVAPPAAAVSPTPTVSEPAPSAPLPTDPPASP